MGDNDLNAPQDAGNAQEESRRQTRGTFSDPTFRRQADGAIRSVVTLTRDQVADALQTTGNTVDRLIRSGELAAFRLGQRWRIPVWAVACFQEKGIQHVEKFGAVSEAVRVRFLKIQQHRRPRVV